MRHLFHSAALALTLFAGVSVVDAEHAEARTHFSFSVGVPFDYRGGPYGGFYGGGIGYGGFYGHRPSWSAYYRGGFPGFYDRPYYRPYVYRPTYDALPYVRPYFGPIVSLSLFPAFVGDTLSYEDRGLYFSAYRRALSAPIGQAIDWNAGRIRGAVTTTRDGWAGQRYCREFRQNIVIDGRAEEAYGTACQQPNGDWQLVRNQ